MIIQNSSSTGFRAVGCLTSQNIIKSAQKDIVNTVDVFCLNHSNDDKFAKFCIDTLDNPPKNRHLVGFKKFQNFFKDFLKDKISDNDYYLTIKDGCEITGFAKVAQTFGKPRETIVKTLFSTNKNTQSEQALFQAISKQAQEDASTRITGRNFERKLNKLNREKTNTDTTENNNNKNFNLFEFLNINFEDRIL